MEDRYAVFKDLKRDSIESFGDLKFGDERSASRDDISSQSGISNSQWMASGMQGGTSPGYDVFTDLDPLGTGKDRPFVDKKDFFNDVRRPPRRLRELGDQDDSLPDSPRPHGIIPPEVSALVASSSLYSSTSPRLSSVTSHGAPTSTNTTPMHSQGIPLHSGGLPESFSPPGEGGFITQELRFQQAVERGEYDIPQGASNAPQAFADFNKFSCESPHSQRSQGSAGAPDEPPPPLPPGALTVALPPESFRDSPPSFSPPTVPRSGPCSPQTLRCSPGPRGGRLKVELSPKTLPRSHKYTRGSHDHWAETSVGSFTPGELTPPTPPRHNEGGISPRPRPRSSLCHQGSIGRRVGSASGRYSDGGDQMSSPEPECRPFPADDLDLSYEEAPEPPPRPAHVEPPPLPPKRQPSHVTLRPPPRPPPSLECQYNYMNDYDSSPDDSHPTSPPIPIPARKPRYSTIGPTPRGSKPLHGDGFQFPKPSISPTRESATLPRASSKDSTPSKSSTPGKSPRGIQHVPSSSASNISGAVDLAHTSLDQLAATLNVPVATLATMTVVELAACIAQLQLRQEADDTHSTTSTGSTRNQRERLSSRDKFPSNDNDEMFAQFDAQFPKSPVDTRGFSSVNTPKSEGQTVGLRGAPVSEDRYAVFRELSSPASIRQKSVFDENFLTPQNSVEDDASELSSGTFKATFEENGRQDSLDQKSSISDDGIDARGEGRTPPKMWGRGGVNDHECVTVFRSPEISEYENFEPNFDGKFDDEFSAVATPSDTPINSPHIARFPPLSPRNRLSPHPQLSESGHSHRSPFTDDFNTIGSPGTTTTTVRRTDLPDTCKLDSGDQSFAKFEDNFVGKLEQPKEKYSSLRGSRERVRVSPFEDDFLRPASTSGDRLHDNGFVTAVDTDGDKFEDAFEDIETSRATCSVSGQGHHVSSMDGASPFDDDFTHRSDRYEVLREVESEREPSLEGEPEVLRLTRGDPPAAASPLDDSWHGSLGNTPHEDQKSMGSLHSIQEEAKVSIRDSPFEDDFLQDSGTSTRISRSSRTGSDTRRSPFNDNFTPGGSTRSLRGSSRGPSRHSIGSDCSDVRQSPFDDNFSNPSAMMSGVSEEISFDKAFTFPSSSSSSSNRAEVGNNAVVDRSHTQNDDRDSSDPFSLAKQSESELVKNEDRQPPSPSSHVEQSFADFDNAFQNDSVEADSDCRNSEKNGEHIESENIEKDNNEVSPSVIVNDEFEEDVFPDQTPEFKVSARFQAKPVGVNNGSSSGKKQNAVDIFHRASDPFDDDFFSEEPAEGNGPRPAPPPAGAGAADASKNANEQFWEEPFDNFSFPKD